MEQIAPVTVLGTVLLGIFLAIASWTDIRSRRISNKLILVGALTGITLHSLLPSVPGAYSATIGGLAAMTAFAGFITGLGILLPFYLLGAMGAGDVKLMAMVGAFLGPSSVVGAVLMTFLVGGALALGAALSTRTLRSTLANVQLMLENTMINPGMNSMRQPAPSSTAVKLPYALAIAAGTLAQVLLERNGYSLLS